MSHTSGFEACPTCPDGDRCWWFGTCLGKLSPTEKERLETAVNAAVNHAIEQVKYSTRKDWFPGPYHPGDSTPDGRNMATLERQRSKE